MPMNERRNGRAEIALDRIMGGALEAVEKAYASAILRVIREKRGPLKALSAILDGTKKPPPQFAADEKQWRQREAKRIQRDAGLQKALIAAGRDAGKEAEQIIREMNEKIFCKAYTDALKRLRG